MKSASAMPVDSPQRLLRYVTQDYPLVLEHLDSLRKSLYFPFKFRTVKPFTMVNLYVTNELGLDQDTRIACAALVDLTGRALTYVDDKVDRSNSDLEARHVIARHSPYGLFGMLLLASQILLRRHESTGILGTGQAVELTKNFYDHARRMDQGMHWQVSRKVRLDNIAQIRVPSLAFVLRNLVDKIAGDLFVWSIEALPHYSNESAVLVRSLVAPMKSFARIFQISDDIADVVEDSQNGQITTATATALSTPQGVMGLKEICSYDRNTKFDKRTYAKRFPPSFATLNATLTREYDLLRRSPALSRIRMSSDGIARIDCRYEELREEMNRRVF